MATITSNNGKLSLTKKNKKETGSGIVSNNGKLSISKKQEPKKVEDAIFASSTPVLPGPSYRQPLVAPVVSNPKVKNQGNLLSMDVATQKDKRADVDDQIAALEAEKKTWEQEKDIWANSQFRGQKWDEAEKQIRDIQARIDTLQKSTFSQDVIDEAQSWQQGVEAYRQQKEEEEKLLRTTATQNTEEIAELEEQAKVYELQIQQLQRSGVMKGATYETAEKNYQDTLAQIETLRQGLSQEQIERAEQLQRMAKLENVTNYVGFDNMSKYQSTRNGQTQYSGTGYAAESGWGDLRYDVINRNEDAVAQAQANAAVSGENLDAEVYALKQMTDEEIAIYNYWYIEDKQQADEYIEMLMPELTKRQMNASLERYAQYAQENPVAASAFSTLISPARGLSYVGQAADFMKTGKIDENAGYNIFARAGTQIRETVGEDIEKALGEKWGKVGSFAYELGMSMGDFLMAAALSGGVGADTKAAETVAKGIATTIMGTGAAAQSVVEAKQRGLTDGQAFTLGTIAGVAEAVTEKYSIEELLNKAALGKGALTYMLRNAVAEGSEEAASGIINTVADVLISRDKSQWQQAVDAYKAMDYDEDHAWRMALTDQEMAIGLDALGGAITGGIIGGTGAAANEIGYNLSRPSGQRVSEQQIMDLIGRIAEEENGGFTNGTEQTAGDNLPDGGRGRLPGQSAGEQTETVRKTGTVDQAGRANDRRSRAQAAGLQPVSGKEQNIPGTTDNKTFSFMPEETWDDEMREVYNNVYKRTGKKIQYIIGQIEVDKGNGVVGRARGVWTSDGRIIVQADHPRLSVGTIAGHEKFHSYEFTEDELLQIKQKVIQGHTPESLERVLQNYWTRLKATIGRDAQGNELTMEQAQRKLMDEVFADADAGINEYDAAKFGNVVREESERILAERNAPKQQVSQATERTTGPPAMTRREARAEQARQAEAQEAAAREAETQAKRTELEQVLEQMREQLAAGNITEEEFDAVYDEIMSQPEMQDSSFSMDAEEKKSVIADLRSYLSGGMTAQQLNERIGQRGAQASQRAEKSTLSNEAQKIKNAARRQRVSVEEYLHRNWELFDVDGQWNDAAREALDDERGVRFSEETTNAYEGKDLSKDSELYDYDFLVALPDMQTVMLPEDTAKKEDGKIDTAETVRLGMENARLVGEKSGEKVYVKNAYTGKPMIITSQSIRHGLNGTRQRMVTNARLGAVIGEVAKNAVPINALTNTAEGVTGTYALAGYATDNAGREIVAILTVEQKSGSVTEVNTYDVVHALSGRQKKSSQAATKAQGFNPIKATKISIEDFLQIVNSTHQSVLSENVLRKLDETRNPDGYYSGRVKFSEETERVERENLPSKARAYLQSAERAMERGIGRALSVPTVVQRTDLREIVQSITDEYLKTGTVQDETVRSLFETAYKNGRIVDDEFYRDNKEVKDYLRTQEITLDEYDQHDIPDWEDWRKSSRYLLRIKDEGGLPVDVAYREVREMAPGLFPESITAPSDQIQRMREVSASIRRVEKNLDEYYGQQAEEFKGWALNDFANAINDHLSELQQVKRYADERAARQAEITVPETVDEIMQLYTEMKDLRRTRDKVRAKNLLTKEDEMLLGKLHRGEISLEDLPEGSNVKGISKVYEAEREYEQKAKIIREYNNRRKQALRQEADEYLQTANDWRDKKTGLQYARETQERNIRDIVPDEALAQEIIDRYFTPVHEAQAQATKLKNETREMVKKMNLSRKVAKGNLVSEAHAVQLLGEAEDNIRVLENSKGRMKARDGKTLAEWRDVVTRLWTENRGLNEQKIRGTVDEFRKIYDRLFQQMNETRVRNGYEPINYRQGYFPHFQPGDTDGILGAFSKALGIDMQTAALPTSINGLTHTFKPGIQWFGNAQERLGFNTAYDAVEGFDKYIEGVADVIYQTDNLQRLRALAAQIRYRTTDEGIRGQVDQVMENPDLSEEDKKNRIEKIYENGKFTLSNFVVDLEEYTNLLANKKSRADRNMEQMWGRKAYQIAKAFESRVAANMVAVNPGSWLTNFIPLTQGGAQLGRGNLLKGMWQTLKNYKVHDGFEGRSAFLTNRRGSDPLVRTWAQSASDFASRPMEVIDTFVADSLVRARTMQNIQGGMSEEAAIQEADAWAAGVMADRSKGSLPTLFNRSNPITKVFTQFQLEVNNQFSYLFKDLPREQKKKGILALTTALLKFFLGAWLYNEIYEYFVGRRPALDPIGMLNTAVGDFTGYQLPNLVELGQDLITGEDPDFTTEKQNRYTAVYNLFVASAEELPFIGGVLGGGRVPIQSALPDFQNLGKVVFNEDWSPEKKLATAGKELMAPATYLLPPFGGGQVKKLLQGAKAIKEKGRYTVNSKGEKQLQYPVGGDDAWEKFTSGATAVVFGPTATKGGREWIENDFPTLGVKETAAYFMLLENGAEVNQAYELVQDVRAAEKTGEMSEAKMERQVLRNAEAKDEEKGIVYYSMLASDKEIALMDLLAETNEDLGTVYQMLDTVKDAENSNVKRQAILDANLTEDEKIAAYRYLMGTKQEDGSYLSSRDDDIEAFRAAGMSFDDFLMAQNQYTEINETVTGAGNKATDFSWWADHQNWTNAQRQVAKEAFSYYSNVPASAGNYDKFTGAGLDQQTAYDLADAIKALEPMEGKSQVSDVQKYKAIADAYLSDEDTLAAFGTIMGEKELQKVQAGYDMAVSPRVYANVKYTLSQFDADGSGSYNQQEIEDAIDAYASSNPLMRLNNGDKAILWQMLTGSTSAKNNPYSRNVAQDYLDRMQEE